MSSDDQCPVCESPLPADSQISEGHVATCIANHIENNKDNANISTTAHESSATQASARSSVMSAFTAPTKSEVPEQDQCPICNISLQSKGIGEREAHINACIDSIETHESTSKSTDLAPAYSHKQQSIGSSYQAPINTSRMFSKARGAPSQVEESTKGQPNSDVEAINAKRRSTGLRGLFASLGVGGEAKTKEQKSQENVEKAFAIMTQRWGPPGSPVYEMVMRYMKATRMQQHWEYLGEQHPRQFAKRLDKGYMEPIPTAWVQSRHLAYLYPEGSLYETPAEKRLYYLLNNGVTPDGSRHAQLYPLNINRDRNTIIRRGNARNARQVRIDAQKLATYGSPGDVFHNDKQIKSHEYSLQVTNTVNEARQRALHELADGIIHGTDHLETMLLIDVSGSMTWNPHQGVVGPDGMRRYHDQPSNIALVQHLVHRVLHHMIPRAQKEHPQTTGIDTVTFSTTGNYIGQLSTRTFQRDWYSKIRLGGGTQVMQGWQVVKNTYFTHQNRMYGHGRFDPVYGWQSTPEMPKLSLLVFLDGEAFDMDEFELELLGETWAYVTIALVGMENCPHHHSHAIELERVAKFNPHVGFFDVHGRVCERLVVEDLLGSVYPVDPPRYSEILKPEFDLPADELPAYKA